MQLHLWKMNLLVPSVPLIPYIVGNATMVNVSKWKNYVMVFRTVTTSRMRPSDIVYINPAPVMHSNALMGAV